MADYRFSLKFDDDKHRLDERNGISVSAMLPLLDKLSKALDWEITEKSTVLTGVSRNSYQLNFATGLRTEFEMFRTLHDAIVEQDFTGLNKRQLDYVETLKKFQVDNGVWMEAFSGDKKWHQKIEEIDLNPQIRFTSEIDEVVGVISQIGSANLNTKAQIKIAGEAYRVNITNEQEKELKPLLKEGKVAFCVEKKVELESRMVKEATLLSYHVLKAASFADSLESISEELKAFFDSDQASELTDR